MRGRLPNINLDDAQLRWVVMGLASVVLLVFGDWPWGDATTSGMALITPTPIPAPTATATAVPPVQTIVDTTIDELNSFWALQFAQAGHPESYVLPGIVYFDPATVAEGTACGPRLREGPPALYCHVSQLIYLNPADIAEFEGEPWSPTWLGMMLAHEWGHHIRYLIDPGAPAANAQDQVPLELQAFCAAGLWAHTASDSGLINPAQVEQYLANTNDVVGAEDTHGSGAQIHAAFAQGLAGNTPADCGYGDPFLPPGESSTRSRTVLDQAQRRSPITERP